MSTWPYVDLTGARVAHRRSPPSSPMRGLKQHPVHAAERLFAHKRLSALRPRTNPLPKKEVAHPIRHHRRAQTDRGWDRLGGLTQKYSIATSVPLAFSGPLTCLMIRARRSF